MTIRGYFHENQPSTLRSAAAEYTPAAAAAPVASASMSGDDIPFAITSLRSAAAEYTPAAAAAPIASATMSGDDDIPFAITSLRSAAAEYTPAAAAAPVASASMSGDDIPFAITSLRSAAAEYTPPTWTTMNLCTQCTGGDSYETSFASSSTPLSSDAVEYSPPLSSIIADCCDCAATTSTTTTGAVCTTIVTTTTFIPSSSSNYTAYTGPGYNNTTTTSSDPVKEAQQQEQVARRLMCKLLYVSSVCADDAVISTDGGITLDELPDWIRGAVEQDPISGQFIRRSPGFHETLKNLHSADPTKLADPRLPAATVRFSVDGLNANAVLQANAAAASSTASDLIVAGVDGVPLLLPISVHHPLGNPDLIKRLVDIPLGSCIFTNGLMSAISSLGLHDDSVEGESSSMAIVKGMLCSEWCRVGRGGIVNSSCRHGINCKYIHADMDAIRRCCASRPCDVAHPTEELMSSCPYAHTISDHIPCMWWYLPSFATTTTTSSSSTVTTATGESVYPSDTLGAIAAARGDANVKICNVFSTRCCFGLRCTRIHPIMEEKAPALPAAPQTTNTINPMQPSLLQQQTSSSSFVPVDSRHETMMMSLLDYAIADRPQPPPPHLLSSSFQLTSWSLPKVLKMRIRSNTTSLKRRYFGLVLEALSKSDDNIWLPLGHYHRASLSEDDINSMPPPPRDCVWYCPSVIISDHEHQQLGSSSSSSVSFSSSSKVYLGVDSLGRPVAVKIYSEGTCKAIASRSDVDGEFAGAYKLAHRSDTHSGLVKYITHAHWTTPKNTTTTTTTNNNNNPTSEHQQQQQVPHVGRYALVTELMNCSLERLLKKWKAATFTTEEVAMVVPNIAHQLISAIRDFHTVPCSNGDLMLFNDLNLRNIMIDYLGKVRVRDAGIKMDVEESQKYCNPKDDHDDSRAPEIRKLLKGSKNCNVRKQQVLLRSLPMDSGSADVYSVGWILGQVQQVVTATTTPTTTTPTTHFQCCLADIVSRCVRKSATDRPTCDELMVHPLMWSAKKCITFLAQFVNPFLPTNAGDYGSEKFRNLSVHFNEIRNYTNWTDVMENTSNAHLKAFWEKSVAQNKSRAERKKGGGASAGNQTGQFQLLRVINNHVYYHHAPFVPEEAMLEAFPYLVMDVYNLILLHHEYGVGVRGFMNATHNSPDA